MRSITPSPSPPIGLNSGIDKNFNNSSSCWGCHLRLVFGPGLDIGACTRLGKQVRAPTHDKLSRKKFSGLMCVCAWSRHASGVAHVSFPVSFMIVRVREHYSWHHDSWHDLMHASSAALTATAPVRSLLHAWPCSAPPRPLLPLPFPAPPLLVIFCAHLTFHHSLSCPISHFPPRFPHAFLTALCPFWHICCLGTGFERLPLVRLPCWRYRWKRLILFFLKSPRTLQFDNFHILLRVMLGIQTHREHVRTTE
jgi:hypothetical protein